MFEHCRTIKEVLLHFGYLFSMESDKSRLPLLTEICLVRILAQLKEDVREELLRAKK
jgi:hypothetical protein